MLFFWLLPPFWAPVLRFFRFSPLSLSSSTIPLLPHPLLQFVAWMADRCFPKINSIVFFFSSLIFFSSSFRFVCFNLVLLLKLRAYLVENDSIFSSFSLSFVFRVGQSKWLVWCGHFAGVNWLGILTESRAFRCDSARVTGHWNNPNTISRTFWCEILNAGNHRFQF